MNIFSNPKTNDFIVTNNTNHYIALAGVMIPPNFMSVNTDRAQPVSYKALGGDICKLKYLYEGSEPCRDMFDNGSITYSIVNGLNNLYCGGLTEADVNTLIALAATPGAAPVAGVFERINFTGAQNGINRVFTLEHEMDPGTEQIFIGSAFLYNENNEDYTISASIPSGALTKLTFASDPYLDDKITIFGFRRI